MTGTAHRTRAMRTALACGLLLVGGCSGQNPEQPSTVSKPSPVTQSAVPKQPVVLETRGQSPASALAWDSLEQSCVVNEGEGPATFRFRMTNVSRQPVVVENVTLSCGCTTFETRLLPFSLAAGKSESLQVRMSLAGKKGTVTKSAIVQGSRESWTLLVTAEVVPAAGAGGMSARERNAELAKADRQAVFQGDCAACHSRFAEGQTGYALYLGACAICHDAEHRASMVPDLRTAAARDAAHWRRHITDGVEGTLMPAFAKAKGGILTDEQIESLVRFLDETPLKPASPTP